MYVLNRILRSEQGGKNASCSLYKTDNLTFAGTTKYKMLEPLAKLMLTKKSHSILLFCHIYCILPVLLGVHMHNGYL